MTYLTPKVLQKKNTDIKLLKAITVLQKEGGGLRKYDHDQRLNCLLTPSLRPSPKGRPLQEGLS